MLNFIIEKPVGSPELIPFYAGFEECEPTHRFGPYVRDSYLIHYCMSGCGILRDKYGEHKISADELFIIRPDESTVYEADALTPWSYIWIGFGGPRAQTLDKIPSVKRSPEEPFLKIRAAIKSSDISSDIYISALYEIFYNIFSEKREEDVTTSVKRYIEYNYMNSVSVSNISRQFGLERSYLYRIFKEREGMSVKEYITEVRMRRASEFLSCGYSVSECAYMSGYADPQSFSRAYKKYFGISPSSKARLEN